MKFPLIRDSFTEKEKEAITAAIVAAERNTSGEIRVYIERSAGAMEVMERAYEAFEKLKMDQTRLKNGVLFYVAFDDHKCAIIGDQGIHDLVGNEFWQEELEVLRTHFRQKSYTKGLRKAIELAGERLAAFFPYEHGDVNELDNDIYFEE